MSNVGGYCRENQDFSTEEGHARVEGTEDPISFVYLGQPSKDIPRHVIHVTMDPSVQRIENNAFQNCTSLCSLVLSKTIEKIGKWAFSGCSNLSHIQWNAQGLLNSIGSQSFQTCSSLVQLDLPHGLVRIENDAFFGCESLRSVNIPKTVESIGTMAFCGCFELVDVNLQEGLKVIGSQAFRSCTSLVDINLPNGLKLIGKSTFCWCKSLGSVVIPETVEIIEAEAFRSCSALVDVRFPGELRYIGKSAFKDCRALSAFALPVSLEEIDSFAFCSCISLIGVGVPSGMKAKFGKGCFNGCIALATISIPKSYTALYNTAFSGCYILERGDVEKRLAMDRFADLPVHDVCYNSSLATVDDLARALDSCSSSSNILEDRYLKDAFGLTPFHVVATLPNDRVDMMDCLLDRYPSEFLLIQDENGMTMMDYLLKQTSNQAVPLTQLFLQKGLVDRIWTLEGKWRLEVSLRIQAMQRDDDNDHGTMTTRQRIRDILEYVGHCMRIEMTSLVELSLWKARMDIAGNEGSAKDHGHRDSCRYQRGAEVLLDNVVGYLWGANESEVCTALSIYPVCSSSVLNMTEHN
ncbi:unnamed protein product [Cylindrotheca closterium]|uniref:Uncharacterized protein n=1 Tax=Cylindrotheca closterium TaxID=2856 RepID=A0AAD2JHZ0_9STRA|nr:unnamed protein product [Cylindrotheca closterium]